MNYTQFFAKGGKIDTKAIKSEIGRIFGIEDSNKIDQLWQNAVDTYGSEEGVLNALVQQIGEDPSDESVQKAMMNILNYTPMEESQMFKCGGKLQKLLAKGGNIDCGCGGVKLGANGMEADGPKTMNWVGPKLAPFIAELMSKPVSNSGPAMNRRVGTIRDRNGVVHYFESADINGRSAKTNITAMPGDTTVVQNVLRDGIGWDPRKYTRQDDQYEPIMQRARPFINGVSSKQEGGELTRRQARELATTNKGYNNAQFNTAFANAMNALRQSGLRGKDLRTRALAMASGYSDQLPIVEAPAKQGTIDFGYIDGLVGSRPTREQLVTPIISIEEAVTPTRTTNSKPRTIASRDQVATRDRSGLTMTPGTTGINMDDVALNEALQRHYERQKAWEQAQLDSRFMYFPRIDSSLEEQNIVIPVSQPVQGTGITMPLTGNEARMAQERYGVKPRTVSQNPIVAVPSRKCGGKMKSKEGIKLVPAKKCGGKTKKK